MNIWRFAVGLLGVVSEDICEIDLYKEHLAKIPSVQLSQVFIQVGGFVWRSLANRYETSTWICLSLRSCRSGEMLLTMVRCWRLIQAGSSETCLQNDAFQTQFLWGELFELTFKGVLRSRVWMIFERRMVWLGSLTPRLTATHQDYDMFSNEQATLINLRLATVTRWKIDPMDWIGTTNKYWRFMKVHVPVSGNVKYRGWKWRSGKFGNAEWWDSSGWIYIPIEYTNLDLKTCFVCCVFCFHIPKVTTRSRPPEERSYWKKHGCTDILKLFWKGDKSTTSKHIRTEIDSVFQWHWKRDLQVVQHLCQFPSFRLGALAEWMVDSYSIHFFYTPKRS